MEGTTSEKEVDAAAASSYTYWVREVREDAAPIPLPKKLNPDDLSNNSQQPPSHLGSAWNRVLFTLLKSIFFLWLFSYYLDFSSPLFEFEVP